MTQAQAEQRVTRTDNRRLARGVGAAMLCACALWVTWRVTSAPQDRTLAGSAGGVYNLAWSPDSKRLAVSDWNELQVWDVQAGHVERQLGGLGSRSRPVSVAWSPDGRTVASGASDGSALVWDVEQGVRTASAVPQANDTLSIPVVVPRRLASAPPAKYAYAPLHVIAFSPEGALATWGAVPNQVEIWDNATSWRRIRKISAPFLHQRKYDVESVLAFSPDGKTLAVGDGNRVYLCDALTGERRRTLPDGDGAEALLFSPDGQRLVAQKPHSGFVIWDTATSGSSQKPHRPLNARGVGWHKDSRTLVVADNTTIALYDADTGKQTRTLVSLPPPHRETVSAQLSVWLPSLFPHAPMHYARITAAALSPDGATLAYATSDFGGPDNQIHLLRLR